MPKGQGYGTKNYDPKTTTPPKSGKKPAIVGMYKPPAPTKPTK